MDGVGDQKKYGKEVARWCLIHDNLADNNSNQIAMVNREIFLLSNLFGRAEELVSSIKELIPDSDDTEKLIEDRIYKRDQTSVVSLVFTEWQKLQTTKRCPQESCAAF